MRILGIESSCDETAAAVVEDGTKVLSSVIASQVDEHKLYGGVVPEIASRRHCENICWVVSQAMEEAGTTLDALDAIAVTYAPGLIGALLVGVNFAKGLSLASGKTLVPVHHIKGHIAANHIAHPTLQPPYICLVASGGHSHIVRVRSHTSFEVLGRTTDDAAGEAFDKVARVIGFPYPGGVQIDKAAQNGNPDAYRLPKPHAAGPYDFSFSGLKTAVINLVHHAQQKGETIHPDDVAASFQKTVCEILVDKLMRAAQDYGLDVVAVAGGVSANSGLRALLEKEASRRGMQLYMPPLPLCGDNAAMIASQGYYELLDGRWAGADLNAAASMDLERDNESYRK